MLGVYYKFHIDRLPNKEVFVVKSFFIDSRAILDFTVSAKKKKPQIDIEFLRYQNSDHYKIYTRCYMHNCYESL